MLWYQGCGLVSGWKGRRGPEGFTIMPASAPNMGLSFACFASFVFFACFAWFVHGSSQNHRCDFYVYSITFSVHFSTCTKPQRDAFFSTKSAGILLATKNSLAANMIRNNKTFKKLRHFFKSCVGLHTFLGIRIPA